MPYNAWSPQMWEGESDKIIKLCAHCEDEILKTKTLCDNCTTKDKRQEMHKANAEIMENYECAVCATLTGKVRPMIEEKENPNLWRRVTPEILPKLLKALNALSENKEKFGETIFMLGREIVELK